MDGNPGSVLGFSSADDFMARPSAATSRSASFGLGTDQNYKGEGAELQSQALPSEEPFPCLPHGWGAIPMAFWHFAYLPPTTGARSPLVQPAARTAWPASCSMRAAQLIFHLGRKIWSTNTQLPPDKPKSSRISQQPGPKRVLVSF